MRILIHDFAGHPFQVQLSRELARRGHSVLHTYLSDLPGPKGPLAASPDDPPDFQCEAITLGAPLEKYSIVKRHFAHRRYARALADRISGFAPDAVLSANTPIDVQHAMLGHCRNHGIAFVHWMQDLYCLAVRNLIRRKLGRLATPLAQHYYGLERAVCRHSDAVVFITADFQEKIGKMGFRPARSQVIENWAPLNDVVPNPKSNPWSQRHGFADKLVFLYSGTLGLKHKPELLYDLAGALQSRDAVLVVVSEGLGRDWLARHPLPNLMLMDFQPYGEISRVLGAADVLVAVLEKEAGVFAVPSKVLSYLCAARPVLLAAPAANLATRTLERANAGLAADPDDPDGFIAAALLLADSPRLRTTLGTNARRYATATFDIGGIGSRFESLLADACTAKLTAFAAPTRVSVRQAGVPAPQKALP
jgi:colanic acid biosynthesis glycosyl transferase WcaI